MQLTEQLQLEQLRVHGIGLCGLGRGGQSLSGCLDVLKPLLVHPLGGAGRCGRRGVLAEGGAGAALSGRVVGGGREGG